MKTLSGGLNLILFFKIFLLTLGRPTGELVYNVKLIQVLPIQALVYKTTLSRRWMLNKVMYF